VVKRRFSELLPLMVERLLDGRVLDGHGDAHLGNIALVDGAVRLFDCIAEPEQLRQRLIERDLHGQDASEANVAVMEKQLRSAQALTQEEQSYRLAVDSAEDAAALWLRFQDQCFGVTL